MDVMYNEPYSTKFTNYGTKLLYMDEKLNQFYNNLYIQKLYTTNSWVYQNIETSIFTYKYAHILTQVLPKI